MEIIHFLASVASLSSALLTSLASSERPHRVLRRQGGMAATYLVGHTRHRQSCPADQAAADTSIGMEMR
jgi:hypothetical protein